jgi:hypothetical protein
MTENKRNSHRRLWRWRNTHPKDVIGGLGGMKVRIPRHYAEYVEDDGDPGLLMAKLKG